MDGDLPRPAPRFLLARAPRLHLRCAGPLLRWPAPDRRPDPRPLARRHRGHPAPCHGEIPMTPLEINVDRLLDRAMKLTGLRSLGAYGEVNIEGLRRLGQALDGDHRL